MLVGVGAAAATLTADGDRNGGNSESGGGADADKVLAICNHSLFIKCNICLASVRWMKATLPKHIPQFGTRHCL